MSLTTTRPTIPTTLPASGQAIVGDITRTTIWADVTLQYYFGGNATLALAAGFQSNYNTYYNGAADTNYAFATQTVRVFTMFDAVMATDFSQTTNTAAADLVLISSSNSINASLEGFNTFPGTIAHPSGGFWSLGVITSDLATLNAAPELGGGEYLMWTLIHEIGHSLGLLHPFNGSGTLPSVGANMDNEIFTVMSYTAAPGSTASYGHAVTPMALDIAALQALYGAETYASGASTYTLLNAGAGGLVLTEGAVSIGRAYYCIWDSGGTDVITYGGAGSVMINLNAATLNTSAPTGSLAAVLDALQNTTFFTTTLSTTERTMITSASYHAGGFFSGTLTPSGSRDSQGYSIAHGAVIENATGGTGADLLVGNAVANTLTGNAGNDTLVGGSGNDTLNGGDGEDVAAYSGARGAYTITANGDGSFTISHSSGTGTDGVDTLVGVEYARFDDQYVNLADLRDPVDTSGPVDFVFLQDLTGSFSEDLPYVRNAIDEIIAGIQLSLEDVYFGASAFRDVGDTFVYQVRAGMSGNPAAVEAAYIAMSASGGGDTPEAQLTALIQAAAGAGLGLRPDSQRIFLLLTDATYHPYYTVEQVRDALIAANALPVFAVTSGVRSSYESLVAQLGFGVVVTLTSDSANLADAIRLGVASLTGEATEIGTDGNDALNGSDVAPDGIFGAQGDDTLEGFGVGDILDGGGGADFLGGGNGDDRASGGTGNDIIFGDNGADTLYGGSGDDQLFGDDAGPTTGFVSGTGVASLTNTLAVPAAIYATPSTAVRMDQELSIANNANIANSTTSPHVSISRTGSGTFHFYVVELTAGQVVTFDIDAGVNFDSYIRLFTPAGVEVAYDDDSSTSEGGGGSTSGYDSFLTYTATASGYYFLAVTDYPGTDFIPAGASYTLHVSIGSVGTTISRPTSSAPGDDILIGNDGNDSINGGTGIDTAVFSVASTAATWTRLPDGRWTVVSADGTDTLTSVEFLDFTDRDVFLDRAMNNFSGDGTSDILLRRTDGVTAIWDMDANGAVSSANVTQYQAPLNWSIQGVGDFNGDGRDDFLLRRSDDNVTAIWSMNGTQVLAADVTNWQAGGEWQIRGVGDFDCDGRDDILWRRTDGVTAIWQLNGTTVSAGTVTNWQAGNEWVIQGVGDFNGDGNDDILYQRTTDGVIAMWHMDGVNAVSGGITSQQAGLDWQIVGVGDFNGDGRDDLALRRSSDSMVAVWTMNGQTVTNASLTSTQTGFGWSVAGIGDYNGDGHDDILWRNDSGTLAVWTMDGPSVLSVNVTSSQVGNDWIVI